jgi:dipeptidyl aminopeptidase/acylaminoacyl peptidase
MKRLLWVLFSLSPLAGTGQTVAENYKKAAEYPAKIKDKVYYSPTAIAWHGDTFWYVQQTPKGKAFIQVNATTKSKAPAFDHALLASELQASSGQSVKADSLPFSTFTSTKDGIAFFAFGKNWEYTNGKIKPAAPMNNRGRQGYWNDRPDDSTGEPVISPDSQKVAVIKNNNVHVYPLGKPELAKPLSFDGSPGEYYSAYLVWSPDSKKIATNRIRKVTTRTIHFVESSPSTQLQPILHTRNYPKPGDALPQHTPVLFQVESAKMYAVPASLIENQFSLSRPVWTKDSRAFTFEYNQRGHQKYQVFELNAETGLTRAIITEESKTFIDYSGKRYRYDVNDGKEILWTSERDGWNHLYLYDAETGKVKHQVTHGNWVVRRVVHVDEKARFVLLEGSGLDQDPYLIHYYKVSFDGLQFIDLTPEYAQHKAYFSKDFKYFVDTYSRVDLPQTTVLRDASTGEVVMEVEKADISELKKAGWRPSEIFSAKGRDGQTDIWGIITFPTHYDPKKKYPVIENIYAGPHSAFVPKTFSANPAWMGELAELGFIVLQVDGMGTSNRSKAFHDVAWKNLKDAGFPDRIAWMKAAAKKYPAMDISKVGIYGTSAGGQNAAGALIFHPEFYKVAVASCGCHDNRMDKIWWNEQWMGYPIGPQYAECSNVENAGKLEGKLLLMVGEVDDNVDPASTYQLVDALIKANKDHDFVMLPGLNHTAGGKYGEQKRRDFFVKHLLNQEPPKWK